MGHWCSTSKPNKSYRVTILGLSGSGKTSLVKRMKTGEFDKDIETTCGFLIEEVGYKDITFLIWDVGVNLPLRDLWNCYLDMTELLVFVVDSGKPENFDEIKEAYQALLKREILEHAKFLVVNHKIDLPLSVAAEILEDNLELKGIKNREWSIISCNAKTGEGVDELQEKMCQLLTK